VLGHVTRGELTQCKHDPIGREYPSVGHLIRKIKFISCSCQGGLYVLGHVTRGELAQCEHDPIGREYPDWLALVDHLKVRRFFS
jgi:hypothetical protein